VTTLLLSLSAGFALGLASTIHCAGMCGGIATSLSLCCSPHTSTTSLRPLILAHLGRISAYALAGAAVGTAGTSLIGWMDRESAFRILQWAGAVALMWIGLSTAGLLPTPVAVDRVIAPISRTIAGASIRINGRNPEPFALGFTWGLMPCAMVYGALFTAMLSATAQGGALVMLGFGAGTLPGLVLTTLGIGVLRRQSSRRELRMLAGLAIATFGFLTVWLSSPGSGVFCL
jgi:uncharacterized protein